MQKLVAKAATLSLHIMINDHHVAPCCTHMSIYTTPYPGLDGDHFLWYTYINQSIPVVPRKAVAEISIIGNYKGALFQHLNVQKCSGGEVLLVFWLPNLLRATTACNFSSFIWPAGSAPAALASLLFDPPEPQIIRKHGKTQCFETFLPFRAPASSFFWLFLFSGLLSSSLLFSDSFHLCFSICPYCRKFDFQTSFDHLFLSYLVMHFR